MRAAFQACIYGGGEAPTPLSLDKKTVNKLIFAGHFLTTIFEIDIDGKKERAIPRDYQLDVVKRLPDPRGFPAPEARLAPARRCAGAFHQSGGRPGIKRGGALNIVYHTVEMWVSGR